MNTTTCLTDYVQDCMLRYGTLTIEDRAIPDYRDGLLPVYRRCLWAAYKQNNSDKLVKTARLVGDVLGKYHPHGDNAVVNALRGLIQASNQMFVGGGNWGSFDNPKSIAAMRYCVTGGTRIRTEHGLVRIKDIPGLYGYDASFLTTPGASFDLDLGVTSLRNTKQTASKWINSGQHKVLRIKTNTDIDIVCTPNHPLLVLNSSFEYEWKCAGDLALGDCLAMNRADVNTLPKSSPISTEMAITLGYCVSEGYLTKNFLYINSAYKGQNDDFRSNFNSALPNAPLIERVCKPSGYGKRKFRSFECNSVATVAKFADLGLYPGNSYSRRVPKVLFSCAKNEVAAFLQGYFEGDGSISIVNGSVLITAHSVSLKLLKEVKLLLWEYFGILTTRVSRERKGGAGHRFFISGVDSIRTFLTEIGFRTARKQVVCDAAIKLCENITVYGGLSKVDVIPHCSTADFKVHKTVRKFRENFHKMPETDRQTMQDVYSANYFHAKVEKIESGGKRWVYDLTVPDTHAFTANGYVVHNTELRLSKLSKMAFFNSYQLKALDLIPNFDGEEVEPVILHTNIPILLLLGATGIAVGSTCGIPSYSLRSVAKLTAMALQGKKITPAMCMSLEFENDWGGHIHPKHLEDGSLLEFYKTGSATLYFRCDYAIEGKNLVITGICPNLDPVKAITKTYDLDCVSHVQDESGMDDIRYVFTLKCKPAEMSEVVNDIVERIWTSFVVMRTNVTERQLTEQAKLSGSIGLDVTFSRMTVPDIINNWAKYRLQLEQTMAKLEIADLQSHNKRLTLTMLAFKYFDIVRDCLTKTDSEQYLATNLSKASGQVVTVEDATYILDKQLKALKRVNLAACKEKVAENTSNIKRLTGVIKSPAASCIDALRLLTKASV